MSIEAQGQIETADVLESYKGDIYAYFDVVEKGEDAPQYNEEFLSQIEGDWDLVCELMGWFDVDGSGVDFESFLVSKNPEFVVMDIQRQIMDLSGQKITVDGEFGYETRRALYDIFWPNRRVQPPPSTPIDREEDARSREIEAMRGKTDRMMQNVQGMVDSAETSIARIDAAGLSLPREAIESGSLQESVVHAYRNKAHEFRRSLVQEEPKLRPLIDMSNDLMNAIEEVLEEIDFSEIKSEEDLYDLLMNIEPVLEKAFKPLEDKYPDEILDEVFMEADPEIFMTFVISAIAEIGLVFAYELQKDGTDFEALASIFEREGIIEQRARTSSPTIIHESPPAYEGWNALVEKGLIQEGSVEFVRNGAKVSLDIEKGEFTIGENTARLNLGEGGELKGVTLYPNGSMELMVKTPEGYYGYGLSTPDLSYAMDLLENPYEDTIPFGMGSVTLSLVDDTVS